MTDTPSNTPEFSVSELSGAIKRTMEESFERVRLRGEISGYRGPHSSGHCYFALKDQNAKIDAIIWKGVFGRLKFKPEEGMEVIATGKVTTFPGKSSYQIVIDQLEPAGVGALLAQLEERKRRLASEGLFEPGRKQLIPYLPGVIGVITSPTGAVIRDILHRIADRFPRHVLIWPVRVQGETCAAEVAAAIEGFNAIEPGGAIPRPDVLIVARGGGSLEDLWGFNEEIVARAAAMSEIPLISAVGHETDTTLIDFVSDLRAPTPTGAAEFVVPVRSELLANTRDLAGRLASSLLRLVQRRQTELRSAARALPSAEALLNIPRQRLDLASAKLPSSLRGLVDKRLIQLSEQSRRLNAQSPHMRLGRYRERLDSFDARLKAAFGQRLMRQQQETRNALLRVGTLEERLHLAIRQSFDRKAQRLDSQWKLLNTLGHKQVLARGYAIVRDHDGHPMRLAACVPAGMGISISFSDGAIRAVVTDDSAPASNRESAKPESVKRTAPAARPGQGSLF